MGRLLVLALVVGFGFLVEAKEPVSFEGQLGTSEQEAIYRDLRVSMGEPLTERTAVEPRRKLAEAKPNSPDYRIRLIAKKQKPEQ